MDAPMLLPDADEVFANASFEALMWALARPGMIRTLPISGYGPFAASLLDRECSFYCADQAECCEFRATGAKQCALSDADYVFADLPSPDVVAAISGLKLGNLLYPDESATLIAAASFDEGTGLRLSGPGIENAMEIAVAGVDRSFWAMRDGLLRYPLGFDLYLVDGDRVIGIPRSTRVEVL